jgi:hypothetical protein
MCEECLGGAAAVDASELDDMAQTLFGVIAALDAHLRRSHRRSSAAEQELAWALQALTATQQRLSQAGRAS